MQALSKKNKTIIKVETTQKRNGLTKVLVFSKSNNINTTGALQVGGKNKQCFCIMQGFTCKTRPFVNEKPENKIANSIRDLLHQDELHRFFCGESRTLKNQAVPATVFLTVRR